jgi:hypothetical protein
VAGGWIFLIPFTGGMASEGEIGSLCLSLLHQEYQLYFLSLLDPSPASWSNVLFTLF